jgi:hypothetical protein
MKLITETIEDLEIITEANENGGKNLFITGPFLQAEVVNRNGRKYPSAVMEREVARYMKEAVGTNRALGELGHPAGPTINLDRVSHMIVDLKKEGNNYIGKAKILDTPMGNIAKNLINSGVKLGVSSRGMGSLKPRNGINEVQDDFYLATAADIVADPSAPDAFVNGIMEGVEWVWDNGLLKAQQLESYKAQVNKAASSANKKKLEETVLKVWNDFLLKI